MATHTLRSLRIQNVRSLEDTGYVDLLPLTLLVGRNSSGKSTFLRSFPLLRQSAERATTGPILWYGSFVDFGSHAAALRDGSEAEGIRFGFRADLQPMGDVALGLFEDAPRLLDPTRAEVEIRLDARGEDGKTIATSCSLRVVSRGSSLIDKAEITFQGDRISLFSVNGEDVTKAVGAYEITQGAGLVPNIVPVRQVRASDGTPARVVRDESRYLSRFRAATDSLFYGNTATRSRNEAARGIGYGAVESVLESVRAASTVPSWQTRTAKLSVDSPKFKAIRSLVFVRAIPLLLRLVDQAVSESAAGVSYSRPVRAAAERYTRKQDLDVDEIDPGGANLVMYLRSLTPLQVDAFQAWTREHLGFGVTPESIQDHVSLNVDVGGDRVYNLADMGFGYSQILPVVAQIWDRTEGPGRGRRGAYRSRRRPAVFAIEQPELHLHPALQARVGDLLVRTAALARRARAVLMVETHSSVIVNRVGQLVAREGVLRPGDAQVLLFESERPDLSRVRKSTYDERGVLSDWPYGFFEPDIEEFSG